MKTIKHIIRGCGWLEHCGDHPGTAVLFAFILSGALGGSNGGWNGILGGAGIMSAFMMPLYLHGAYERSILDEKLSKNNQND